MRTVILFLLSLLSTIGNAQLFDWADRINSKELSFSESTKGLTAVDEIGNIFTSTSLNYGDEMLLQKWSESGELLWTKSWVADPLESCIINGITLDTADNIILTGRFGGELDFDPGVDVYELSEYDEDTGSDFFVLKLDNDGNFVWVVSSGGTGYVATHVLGKNVDVDSENNLLISGPFEGTIDFDPGPGTSSLSCPASIFDTFYSWFILKLNSDGEFIWVKELPLDVEYQNGRIQDIAINSADELFLTGFFLYEIDFDPGAAEFEMTAGYERDAFILKLNASGDFEWAKQFGGDYFAYNLTEANAIKINSSGDVVCSGEFTGVVDFDPNEDELFLESEELRDAFIIKLTDSGELLWARQLVADNTRATTHDLNASDAIFISGGFDSDIDIDPGDIRLNLDTEGNTDIFIVKLDASGNFVWGKSIGGDYEDFGEDIIVTTTDDIINKGRFDGTVDFDPGDDTYNVSRISEDSSSYILKLTDCDPLVSVDSVTQCEGYTWSNGITYYSDRKVGIVSPNEVGCDSIHYLFYDRLPNTYSVDEIASCEPYEWIDGEVYANDTSVTLYYENVYGCDSTLILDFVFIEPVYIEDTRVNCTPFVWLDGETYYNDTLLTYITTTDSGCDSIWIMDLEFPPVVIGSNVNRCYSYTWVDGITYYSDTLVSHTIDNPLGCDTLLLLNITIEDVNIAVTEEVSACMSYNWIDGNTYVNDTSVTFHIDNPLGCDTLHILNLTVVSVNITVSVLSDHFNADEEDAVYTWLDCADFSPVPGATDQTFYPVEFGDYAVIIEKDGCIDTSDCYTYFIDDSSTPQNDLELISLFPNPGVGLFNLSLPPNQNLSILIVDMNGRLVQRYLEVNEPLFQFNLTAESGLYNVIITSQNQTRILKLTHL